MSIFTSNNEVLYFEELNHSNPSLTAYKSVWCGKPIKVPEPCDTPERNLESLYAANDDFAPLTYYWSGTNVLNTERSYKIIPSERIRGNAVIEVCTKSYDQDGILKSEIDSHHIFTQYNHGLSDADKRTHYALSDAEITKALFYTKDGVIDKLVNYFSNGKLLSSYNRCEDGSLRSKDGSYSFINGGRIGQEISVAGANYALSPQRDIYSTNGIFNKELTGIFKNALKHIEIEDKVKYLGFDKRNELIRREAQLKAALKRIR